MSAAADDALPPLAHEHLLLGATLGEVPGANYVPLGYAGEADALSWDGSGCFICDLAGLLIAHISGADAPSFAGAACANAPEAIGECRPSAVLMGDGSLASVVLAARTGDAEYLGFDLGARQDVAGEWLHWLACAEQEGVRAFADCQVEDASDALSAFLMAGGDAANVLSDYLSADAQLPEEGRIASVELDGRPCLVAHGALGAADAFLVLTPPQFAVAFWRSLLSFNEVAPLGRNALTSLLERDLGWWGWCGSTGKIDVSMSELCSAGVARAEGGYVGYRALAQRG